MLVSAFSQEGGNPNSSQREKNQHCPKRKTKKEKKKKHTRQRSLGGPKTEAG